MSKSLKITLFAIGGSIILLVLITVALILSWDINAYKPHLQTTASMALGMDVRIDGGLGIGIFPHPFLTLRDVHIRNRGEEIASATEARFGVDLLPMLQKKIRIRNIAFDHPTISIERNRDGRFNFEKPDTTETTSPALDMAKLSLSHATLIYTDKQSGHEIKATDCSLDMPHARLSRGQGLDTMKNLTITATLNCRELRTRDFTATDLEAAATAKDGLFDIQPVTMRVFGANGSGRIHADFSATPLFHVHYVLPQFDLQEFFMTLSSQPIAEGSMDFSADLSMRGKSVHAMRQTLEGHISLRGKNLTLIGRDLDRAFSRFESSQNLNLVDAGAFFFAGPFGLLVTKGYDFASIFQASGDRSKIRNLVSDWKVNRGVALAQDVAMATDENRIVLHGRLDLINERFADATIALIDPKGCVKVQQKIHGSFQKPVIDKPSDLQSLTGTALKLIEKGKDILTGEACDVFYTGSVAPPK